MKFKKPLLIVLIVLDVAITVFDLVVSIIMLAQTAANPDTPPDTSTFIGYLQKNTTFYLWVFVIPLFVLLAANIIGLVVFVRKSTKKEPVQVNDLTEEQKEALRRELLNDLNKENEEK